jgi:hypothetical protein
MRTVERDRFKHSKRSLFAVVEKNKYRLIQVTSSWIEHRIDSQLASAVPLLAFLPLDRMATYVPQIRFESLHRQCNHKVK